jgi:hypothetical protein
MERCRDKLQHLTLEHLEQFRGRNHLLRQGRNAVLEVRESYEPCILGIARVDLNNVRALPARMDVLEPRALWSPALRSFLNCCCQAGQISTMQ